MIAGIEFTVYRDYSQYLSEENDYEYDKALEVLNEQVKKHVENNELTFLYGRKRVNPILPIEMSNTGNIFDEPKVGGSCALIAPVIPLRRQICCDPRIFPCISAFRSAPPDAPTAPL